MDERHHLVELRHHGELMLTVRVRNRDIGATVGTTLRFGRHLIAHYRPGTRHQGRALEIAVAVLADAFGRCVRDHGYLWVSRTGDAPTVLREAVAGALAAQNCRDWDGLEPELIREIDH
jgi:hypothetical protein